MRKIITVAKLAVIGTVSALADQIREDILDGVFAPGQLLTQRSVAARYGVSRIPLREALRRLEPERWVLYHPNRGAFVTEITAADVHEMYEMRRILEAAAIRLAMRQIDDETLASARSLDASMRRSTNLRTIIDLHNQFHEKLYAAAGNGRLLDAIASNRVHVQRLPNSSQRMRKVVKSAGADHRRLLDACKRRDRRAAERAAIEECNHLEAIMSAGLDEDR
jgi:DNA-binding GntR family transcriptional regulator